MARELKAAQHELAEEVTDMQRIGGGVEADVDADRTFGQPPAQRIAVGGVVHETTGLEVGEQLHDGSCSHLHRSGPRY